MPTYMHYLLVDFLHSRLKAFVTERKLGSAFFAPMPVYFDAKNYREPDVGFVRPARLAGRNYPAGADLVIEVVSEDNESRKRDYEEKRRDYAAGAVPEYWIVDPQDEAISVLVLDGAEYRLHGKFAKGDVAKSVLLNGFSIDVAEMYAAAKLPQ